MVEQGKFVRPVHVNVGMTDGIVTEVEEKDLTEGLQVVVGEMTAESKISPGTEKNPFTPQMGQGKALKVSWI